MGKSDASLRYLRGNSISYFRELLFASADAEWEVFNVPKGKVR